MELAAVLLVELLTLPATIVCVPMRGMSNVVRTAPSSTASASRST